MIPLADIVFIGLAVVVLFGAILAVALRNVFYNALALVLCLFGVAGLFVYLNAEFLAIMEVIIYIGAISVAIIFAIMLSRPQAESKVPQDSGKSLRAFVVAAFLFAGIVKGVLSAAWPQQLAGTQEGDYSIRSLGKALLGVHALPFETVSVVLLIAIIGALLVSMKEAR